VQKVGDLHRLANLDREHLQRMITQLIDRTYLLIRWTTFGASTKLCDGAHMQIFASFLHPVFPASSVQHISDMHSKFSLECGPMPNMMVALPNIGGALCSMPQSLSDAHYLTAVQ